MPSSLDTRGLSTTGLRGRGRPQLPESTRPPYLLDRLLRLALLLPVVTLLSACATIGAGSVKRDRVDYSEALTTSWKEQTLLNIVKLRYADTPVFLEVSSIIGSYQLQSQLSLLGTVSSNLTPNLPDALGRGVTLGATGIYTDKPTITYTPCRARDSPANCCAPLRRKRQP
jgi:hypothetical protein